MAMNQEWKEVGSDFAKIGSELVTVFGKLGKLTIKAVGEGASLVKDWADTKSGKAAPAQEEPAEAPVEEAPAEEAPAEEAAEETRTAPNANWEAARDAAVEALNNFSKVAMSALQTGKVYMEEAAGKVAEKLHAEQSAEESAEAPEAVEIPEEAPAEEAAEEPRFVPNPNWEAARDAAVEALNNFSKVAMKAIQTGMVYVEEAAGKAAEKLHAEQPEEETAEDTETAQEVAAVVEEAITAEEVGAVVEEALKPETEE